MLILTEESPAGFSYFKDRIAGVKDAFNEHQISFSTVTVFSVPIDYRRYKSSAESFATRTLIPFLHETSGSQHPTAMAVMSDFLAGPLIHALSQNNFQVPEQISVASFGGWDISNYFPRPVTSWVQPIPDLLKTALHAVELILSHEDFHGDFPLGSVHADGVEGHAKAISAQRFVVSGFLRHGGTIQILPQ